MAVPADTSPLNYLIIIGVEGILPELYGAVVIPSGVLRELRQPGAPLRAVDLTEAPPAWLRVDDSLCGHDPRWVSLGQANAKRSVWPRSATRERCWSAFDKLSCHPDLIKKPARPRRAAARR